MIRRFIPLVVLICLSVPLAAQNLGDQYTAGFTGSRTYANVDVANLRAPLRLFETINLSGINNAQSLAVFEDKFLVGQGGASITYKLFNRSGGSSWTVTLPGGGTALNYVPALAGNVAILGGASTTSVRAVSLSSGTEVWGAGVGDASGRYPVLTDDLAIYGGANRIAVARASTGQVFWQLTTSTAASAISVFGNSLYFLDQGNALRSYQIMTGQPQLDISDVASAGASIIPTEKFVFVGDPSTGFVAAIDVRTGVVTWTDEAGGLSTSPGLALAGGTLFAFVSQDGDGGSGVIAYDPATGDELWTAEEEGEGIQYGFAAGTSVFYYAEATNRVRVRDAATGALLWSIPVTGVRGLTAANDELVVLLSSTIRVYRPANEIFMAQMANGGGQSTLLVLSNTGSAAAEATVNFFDEEGDPLSVPVGSETVNHVDVTIPALSSIAVQTEDTGGDLLVGWVKVEADRPLRGTSIFQYATEGEIVREVGVADSAATGLANVILKVGEGFDTAIAMVNPTQEESSVTLRLLNASGTEIATKPEALAPGEHLARFAFELFPDDIGATFEGTIVIEADVPLSITALRTKGALQMSSFPVGQPVR